MFRRIFGAQESVFPSLLQPSSYQDNTRFRAEAHPLHQSIASLENQFQNQEAGFSVAQEPISHGTASTPVVDQNGQSQEVNPGLKVSKSQSGSRSGFLSTWWLEIISCVLFIGALVAVMVTVGPYEGRPLPQMPYQLSINTLIAIYMVVLKAAMLLVAAEGLSQLKWRWFDQERPLKDLLTYDDASRGPWGSLTLLWRLRGRQLASSCGAFITVAALIVDPFAQQVIDTFECRLPAKGGVATIPRTNSFTEKRPDNKFSSQRIPPFFKKSFNAGIFNPGHSIPFDCSTGNCTFPDKYHTVGYCSECNDTTNMLSVQSIRDEYDDITYNVTVEKSDFPENVTIRIGNYSFDSTPYFVMETSTYTDMIASNIVANKTSSCQYSCPSLAHGNIDDCNAKWDDLKWGCASLNIKSDPRGKPNNVKVGAASCSLRPCVRTYTAEIETGRLKEELISVSDEWRVGEGFNERVDVDYATVDVGCLNENEKQALTDAGYKPEGKSWMPVLKSNEDTSLNKSLHKVPISWECIYQVGVHNVDSIEYFLTRFLNGTVFPGYGEDNYYGELQLQAIFNEGNIDFERINETWKNISDAITWYMRQNGETNRSAPARGESYQTQTCVHIRWLFLLYPAILVLLATIFFTVMVYETRGRDISRHDWKSSPLALLFHGLDRQSMGKGDYASVTGAREMARIADHTLVRLAQTDHGWQFSSTGDGA